MNWRAHGVKAWLLQRLSALYLLIYLLGLGVALSVTAPWSYEDWRAFMGSAGMSTATLGFFIALLAHAWVGTRDVLMDYVHTWWLRFACLVLAAVGLSLMGLWVLLVLIRAS